jgi:hypothetical protein
MKTISLLNNTRAFILFILLSSFLPLLYSIQGVTDQFLFEHIAYTTFYLNSSHFPLESPIFSPKYIPGTISYYLLFCKVTNISPEIFQFLPLAGLILPLAYFSLCKKLSGSSAFSAVFTICMMFTVPPSNFFTVWTHAWGYFLFIIFVLIYVRVYKNKDFNGVFLLLILFTSIHFYSYTAEMWSLAFSILFNLFLISTVFSFKNIDFHLITMKCRRLSLNISLCFVIITFMFNKIIYNVYLSKGRFLDTLVESSSTFYHVLILHEKTEISKYAYVGESHMLLTFFGALYYFLILFIIILIIKQDLISFISRYKLPECVKYPNVSTVSQYVLLLVGIVDVLIYSTAGLFTSRTVCFIYPIVSAISLNRLNISSLRKKRFLILILGVVLIHTSLSLHYESLPVDYTKYKYVESSASWFMDKASNNEALTDLRTGNKYVLYGSSSHLIFSKNLIGSYEYDMIVNPENTDREILHDISDYIIINTKIKSIQSMGWGNFEPFNKYMLEINHNNKFHKIYNDNSILILYTQQE